MHDIICIDMETDIRWKQRFQNYCKAFWRFSEAVMLANKRKLSDIETQGLIQSFEFTQELSWKTLKDFLEYKGASQEIIGSRDAVRLAFSAGIISDGDIWMDMIASRNASSHTYNEETAAEIAEKCVNLYCVEFQKLKERLEKEA